MAELRPHYIDVDLKKNTQYNVPVVTQNDTATHFIIRVTDDGLSDPELLDAYQEITMTSQRPDGESFYLTGTRIPGTNEIEFHLGTDETAFSGSVLASLQFYLVEDASRYTSAQFRYDVKKDLTKNYTPTQREETLVEVVLRDGPGVIQEAREAIQAADGAIVRLEEVTEENKTVFRQPVNTFADLATTYPNPEHGTTVRVTGESATYRYSDGSWVKTDEYNPTAIDQVTAQLAETGQLLNDVVDGEIQAVLESEIVSTDIENKLNAKEAEYAPRLANIESETETPIKNLMPNAGFKTSPSGWVGVASSLSVDTENGILTATSTGTNIKPQLTRTISSLGVSNYFTKLQFRLTDPNGECMNVAILQGSSKKTITDFVAGEWYEFEGVFENADFFRLSLLWEFPTAEASVGSKLEIRRVLTIDLKEVIDDGEVESEELKDFLVATDNTWFEKTASIGNLQKAFLQRYFEPINEDTNVDSTDVKAYGAKGDGAADDTNAIQQALNENAGGKVFLSNGSYKVTGTLFVPPNTVFEGAGKGSKIFLGDGFQLTPIEFRRSAAFNYDGFPIITNARPATGEKTGGVIVRNMAIEGYKVETYAERLCGVLFADAESCKAVDLHIEHINYFPSIGLESRGFNLICIRSNNIEFTGGYYSFGGYECVGVYDYSTNVSVRGIYSGVGWRTSLQVHRGCENITIDGNHIIQNEVNADGALTLHAEAEDHSKKITITNNIIDAIVAPSKRAFQINGSGGEKDVIMTGNQIKCNADGLYLPMADRFIFKDNIVECGGFAVSTLQNSKDVTISGNDFRSGREIRFITAGENIKILDNNLTTSISAGVILANGGAGVIIKGNKINAQTYGIWLPSGVVTDLTISGNAITTQTQHGIMLDYRDAVVAPNWLISENIMSVASTVRAISLNANVLYPIIKNNVIKSGGVGIRIALGVDYALIADNNVVNAVSKIEAASGSNNILRDNLGVA